MMNKRAVLPIITAGIYVFFSNFARSSSRFEPLRYFPFLNKIEKRITVAIKSKAPKHKVTIVNVNNELSETSWFSPSKNNPPIQLNPRLLP